MLHQVRVCFHKSLNNTFGNQTDCKNFGLRHMKNFVLKVMDSYNRRDKIWFYHDKKLFHLIKLLK